MALTANNPITAQPHLQQQLRYGMDTFRYVCLTYYAPYVLMAGPQAPFKTFAEFVKFAKAKSENLVYGHPGVAGQPHLVMLAVLKAIGADGLGVPFQGAGPMSHALLGGTIMAITESPAVARASNLPILAAIIGRASAGCRHVPTHEGAGLPDAWRLFSMRRRDAIVHSQDRPLRPWSCSKVGYAPYRLPVRRRTIEAIVERHGRSRAHLPGGATIRRMSRAASLTASAKCGSAISGHGPSTSRQTAVSQSREARVIWP